MDYKIEKKIKDVYDIGKYARKLELCRDYIDILNSGNVTENLFMEAEKFSSDTYKELSVEKPIIAKANTCLVQRKVTPLQELQLNLKAVERMLKEAIAENGYNSIN